MAGGGGFSVKSLAFEPMEEITVAGFDTSYEMMEAAGMPLGVVASKEDDEEDGLDENGMDHAAAALLGAWI